MGDEIRDAKRLKRFVELEPGPEQLLDSLDAKDLRTALIRYRRKRRTHALRTILWILPLSYPFLRAVPFEGEVLAILAPAVALAVVEFWRAVSSHLRLQELVRLSGQVEESV